MKYRVERLMLLGFLIIVIPALLFAGESSHYAQNQKNLQQQTIQSQIIRSHITYIHQNILKIENIESLALISNENIPLNDLKFSFTALFSDIEILHKLLPEQTDILTKIYASLKKIEDAHLKIAGEMKQNRFGGARAIYRSEQTWKEIDSIQKTLNQLENSEFYHGIHIHNRQEAVTRSATSKQLILQSTIFIVLTFVYFGLFQINRAKQRAYRMAKKYSHNLEIQKARLQEVNWRLEAQATSDGLTGLKNHRAFEEQLALEFERAVRYNHALSIVLLDVDYFKHFNDSYGHPEGDEVLKKVAWLIQHEARRNDFVARYGGEEFVLILPDTNHDKACLVAEKFRQRIANSDWELRPITASFGVSSYLSTTKDGAELVESADIALYYSKCRGRNRITHAWDIPQVEQGVRV